MQSPPENCIKHWSVQSIVWATDNLYLYSGARPQGDCTNSCWKCSAENRYPLRTFQYHCYNQPFRNFLLSSRGFLLAIVRIYIIGRLFYDSFAEISSLCFQSRVGVNLNHLQLSSYWFWYLSSKNRINSLLYCCMNSLLYCCMKKQEPNA